MNAKVILYIVVTIITIWSLDAININQLFKKNRVIQARIIYFLIAISIIYLVTNFFWDFFLSTKL